MTTHTTNTVVDQTSDAAFRTWVAEFIVECVVGGTLVQTADTGQINTASVVRAAINSDAGYAVFRFTDTLQATVPVFVKFFFGSGSATTIPRIRVQVGTASNGSGTISGTGSANTDTLTGNGALVSIVTPRASYTCGVSGCFGMSWKVGSAATNTPSTMFQIARSTDSTGATTGDAIYLIWGPATAAWSTARSISFLTSTVYTTSGISDWATVAYSPTSSLVGGVPQVFKAYYVTPRDRPMNFFCICLDAEFSRGTTFTATLIGSTSHTYINVSPVVTLNAYGACMLWE